MIQFKSGNLLAERADALVNPVNCVGVMGRGLARQFKEVWPENFEAYAVACSRGEVQHGRMFVFETGCPMPRFIVNFPTKRHWREKSRIEDIAAGLDSLVREVRARGIQSIAIPPLGAGLGGLNWAQVRPLIEGTACDLPDVVVTVFVPSGLTISECAAARAEKFVRLLPSDIRTPQVSPEPDGSVSLDWIRSRRRLLSISVGMSDRLEYMWIDGTDREGGVFQFDGERIPSTVIQEIIWADRLWR